MNLIKYWLLIITGAVAVGILPKPFPQSNPQDVRLIGLALCMLLLVPTIAILRMRSLKISWKEFLIGLIPFYGIWYRFRRLSGKQSAEFQTKK